MRIFVLVLLAIFAIASVTNGLIQELCATLAYIGLGVAAVVLYVDRRRSRRSE